MASQMNIEGELLRKNATLPGRRPDFFLVLFCACLIQVGSSFVFGQNASPAGSTDPAMAADLQAATRGDVQAQIRVGKAFNQGTSSSRANYPSAAQWFEAAAKAGSAEGSAWLGSLYLQGHGVPQDVARAAALIQPAANQKNPIGLRFMGIMLENGQGMSRDYRMAARMFFAAARKGDANSLDHLGVFYLRGLGVKKNVTRAGALFTKGARLGDPWAQLHLGEMYLGGLIRPSGGGASTGPTSPAANEKKRVPLTPNFAMALKMFTDSAAQGNRVAAFSLGTMYEKGQGTAQNYQQALSYYRQAASRRYALAQLALGRAAELGLGTSINLPYAYAWYSMASAQNNSAAAVRLQALALKMSPDEMQTARSLVSQVDQLNSGN